MNFEQITNCLPFIGLATANQQHSPLVTRLIEAAIIGLVTAFLTVNEVKKDLEWSQKLTSQQLKSIERDVSKLDGRVSILEKTTR